MVLETAEQTPQVVEAIQRLSAAGWGRRRMARELGCSPETVRKYLRQRFLADRGNADVA
jgi:DNA-binding NarL/FixJ family response regulator